MADYNPDDLNAQAEESTESVDGLSGEIAEIEQGTAGSYFGENVQGEPDKAMLRVTTELPNGDDVINYFSLPDEENPEFSWVNPTFKLARFRHRYGAVPEEGMEVDITVEDGFMTIDLPDRVPEDEAE